MFQIYTKKIKRTNKEILSDVSFSIYQGEIIGFVGNNGSGKTTTIKAIFNETKLSAGEITYEGDKLSWVNLKDVCFFPDTNNMPLDMTLNDFLTYSSVLVGLSDEEIKTRTAEVFQVLNLEPYKKFKLKKLSAGWKKIAMMASVIIRKPKYIFFDEPTANVDVATKNVFYKIFNFLHEHGSTLFITSHIIEEPQQFITRLIIINEGKILYDKNFNKEKEKNATIFKDIGPTPITTESDKKVDFEFYEKKNP